MAHGVQLIAIKSNIKDPAAGSAGKKNDAVNSASGEDKKTSFAGILRKTGQQLLSPQSRFFGKNTNDKDANGIKLSRLAASLSKSIKQNLLPETRKKLLSFLNNVNNNQHITEKEKANIFSGLLKKLKEKKDISSRLIDSLSGLLSSLNSDPAGKNKVLKNTLKLIDSIQGGQVMKSGKSSAGESEPKLVVIDMRKIKSAGELKKAKNQDAEVDASAGRKNPVKSNVSDNSSDQLVFVSRKNDATLAGFSENAAVKNAGQAGAGREYLQKLEKTVQDEMVKQTRMIIKEGGRGEIRIVLKPESLGHVRLKVNLDNNHIDGKIFVENNSIKQIFEQALEHLSAALQQEGYDSVSLHVSVGNGNTQNDREKSNEYVPENTISADASADAVADAAAGFEKNLRAFFDAGPDFTSVNLIV